MHIKTISIDQIHPNDGQMKGLPTNPRLIKGSKYKLLVQSIKDDPEMLSLRELLVYDTNDKKQQYIVVGGNMRYRVLRELGYKEAPCKIIPHGFPIEKLRRIALKDNSQFGQYDFDILLNEWNDDEISLAAIDLPEITPPETGETAEDDNFQIGKCLPKEAKAKPGDIYALGVHRLICGDSSDPKYLKYLMIDDIADLIITDPPYNVNYKGKGKFREKLTNDAMSEDDYLKFIIQIFDNTNPYLKQGGAFYIWHADGLSYLIRKAVRAVNGWDLSQVLIWVKNHFTLSRQDYQWKHEQCLYGWKQGKPHYFVNKQNLITTIEEAKQRIDELSKEELKNLLITIAAEIPTTVIYEDKPLRSDEHPTMKPIPLIGRLIANSSRPDEIVLDPFGGSGTTLIACEQLKRKCRMIEIDPRYVDVIIKRWEEQTGEKAILISNIEKTDDEKTNDRSTTKKHRTAQV